MKKMFANIFKKSLPAPKSQVKNSFIFKDLISKTKIPMDHIKISLNIAFLFTNIPMDLVKNSREIRSNLMKSATKLRLQKFQKELDFLKETHFSV